MGRQLGGHFADRIRRYVNRMYVLAIEEALAFGVVVIRDQLVEIARTLLPTARTKGGAAFEELAGLSDESGVGLADVLFAIGYSDVLDILIPANPIPRGPQFADHGCTSVLIADSDGNRILAGQTWDMPVAIADDAIILRRQYKDGKTIISLTTVLGLTHCGLNHQRYALTQRFQWSP
jgi:hypothetical protein